MLVHFGRPEGDKIIVNFYLSPLSRRVLGKKTVPHPTQKKKNFLHFVRPECSVPCSQDYIMCICTEPHAVRTLSLCLYKINLILRYRLRVAILSSPFPSSFTSKTLYALFKFILVHPVVLLTSQTTEVLHLTQRFFVSYESAACFSSHKPPSGTSYNKKT